MGPPPWAPTPPDYYLTPAYEHRSQPDGCTHNCNQERSSSFEGPYQPKLVYDYCLKRDLEKFYKSQTLPRNLGSSCEFKGPRVYPVLTSPYKRNRTFVVTADIEAPR